MGFLSAIQNQLRRVSPGFIWTATGIGLSVMLIFFAVIAVDFYKSTIAVNNQSARNIAALIEQGIARDVELYDLSLQGVIEGLQNPDVMKQPPEVRQIALFDRSATAQGLGALVYLDETGAIRLDSVSAAPRMGNFADREYFNAHRNAPADIGLYISRPFRARLQGDIWCISLSRRVSKPDGSFGGIVSGTVRLSYFRERFEQVSLGIDGSITLFRDDGIILTRNTGDDSIIGANRSKAPLFEHLRTQQSGTYYNDLSGNGIPRYYTFERIAQLPLIISVGLSEGDMLAPWWSKVRILAAAFIVMAGSVIALVFLFVSELKRRVSAEQSQARLARLDNLTKLANRRGFEESLEREWKRGSRDRQPLSLVMVDIDYFKLFNDTLGHPEGDRALAAVGLAVADAARRPGDVAARYGGEEVAVLLPNTGGKGAMRVAQVIQDNLARLNIAHPASPYAKLTASMGVATVSPAANANPNSLVTSADSALYLAKSSGRNTIRESNISAPHFGVARRVKN